jgi:hypothetical protein
MPEGLNNSIYENDPEVLRLHDQIRVREIQMISTEDVALRKGLSAEIVDLLAQIRKRQEQMGRKFSKMSDTF